MSRTVRRWFDRYLSAGFDDREAARAAYFIGRYGPRALDGPGCVTFEEPSCRDWNCIKPDHQRVGK
jgi:hypothetical protein